MEVGIKRQQNNYQHIQILSRISTMAKFQQRSAGKRVQAQGSTLRGVNLPEVMLDEDEA